MISYPKEGENIAATAKRLGVPDDKMDEFKQLNSAACNRSHGGWFKLGEKVILPAGMEEVLKLDGYEVDKQAEVAKFKQKTASTTTAAIKANTAATATESTTNAPDAKQHIQLATAELTEAKNMTPAEKAQAIYTGNNDIGNCNYAVIFLSGEQRWIEVEAHDNNEYCVIFSTGNTGKRWG